MAKFNQFHWDSDAINKLPKFDFRFYMNIHSKYKWGESWERKDAEEFKSEIFPKLEAEGFTIAAPEIIGACEMLKSKTPQTNIYVHPMEITGYATETEIETLLKIFIEADCIYGVELSKKTSVFDISDDEYKTLIDEHAAAIEKCFCKNDTKWNIGFDFAEHCRLPRVGDSAGLCAMDTDIKMVSELFEKWRER